MAKSIYRCAKCRNPLSLISTGIEAGDAVAQWDSIFYLEPCGTCMGEEYDDGHEDGVDDSIWIV